MKTSLINTRSIVIVGYCLLVALAIIGIFTIYYEVIKSHRQSQDNSDLKRELIDLSNTLTTMYQAEGTASLLAFADNEKLKFEYDSLTHRVFDEIDSLQLTTNNPNIRLGLDSLSVLLMKKHDNALEMFQLMNQMDKNIVNEITKRTIITRNDINKLNTLLADVTQIKDDTVKVLSEKKGFFQRVRDVVKSDADTLTKISQGSVSETKKLTVPLLSDTIVDFIRQIDKSAQKRNVNIIQQLLARQQVLYTIKELTGLQIDKIMDTMKELEYQSSMNILKNKNESLKRSSSLVAIVGLSALIVVVFFMSWTLQSLNKAQQLQKNIQEAKKHAEKLLMSREQLIYTITHDIKAPLSSIIGFLDLLMSEATLSKKQWYYLNNMHLSASHILDLVRNLLDFHSIEKEQPQLTSIAFSPASLIRSIYESFLPLIQKKELKFELKSTFPEAKTFLSDPYYIRQIVNNLLSNAIKFTPEQGQISLISSQEKQHQWKISIQDTGPGIEEEDQVKIFEEFVRLGKTIEGTGLGLTISKQLTSLLGGTIEIESQKGIGSIFTLTIPLTPVTENPIFQPENTSDIASGQILFVDDDQVQLNLLSELMKREEWPCICCLSAYEALDVLREKSVDIIFTDIHIPGMEGFELVKQIRESNFLQAKTIPVIAFSANCQKSETELKEAGFNGFLLKPFKVQQLLEIIEKFTSFKRKTDESYLEQDEFGWRRIMDFVIDDQEAAIKIIDSFIEETNKNRELLKVAFQKKDSKTIKQISHKMLSLMRMIPAQEIISILTEFETNSTVSKEKKETLFRLLDEVIKEAETTRQAIGEMAIIN